MNQTGPEKKNPIHKERGHGVTKKQSIDPSKEVQRAVTIPPPNFQTATFMVEGTAPYVQNAFTKKAREQMEASQREGQRGKKRRRSGPRNFEEEFPQSKHTSIEGWDGIPAASLRSALISACKLVHFKMTIAKVSLFIEADGFDIVSGQPLVRILKGKAEMLGPEPMANADGSMDLRVRAIWAPGWRARVRIRFDADQFTLTDVANLLNRAGVQIGIGAGRPDSKNSPGQGWGLFSLVDERG